MNRAAKSALRLPPVASHLYARPRLALALVVCLAAFALLPGDWKAITRGLAAWNIGILVYLVAAFGMMGRATTADIRKRAPAQDDGKFAVLGLTILTAVASLAAIVHELGEVKSMPAGQQGWPIALAGLTVLFSWLFMHTMFALHYAHDYYGDDDTASGILFPGKDRTPDYWDFLHFSYIMGCAAQTADIQITSPIVRRLVTVHCVVAFFFNTTVLALTVNIGAGLMN